MTRSPRPAELVGAPLARAVDAVLEVAVPVSFSAVGLRVRRALGPWPSAPDGCMTGRRVVVTGATRGLGREAAEAFLRLGADVDLVVRDRARGEAVAEDLVSGAGPQGGSPTVRVADLGELAQVRALADELAAGPPIDVLVHNAGAIVEPRTETSEGVEVTWASMVLGPFLLTRLLGERLAAARVIWVTSGGLYAQALDLDDPQGRRGYRGTVAYARAKRAQVDLVAELAGRRLPTPTTTVVAVHPGWADTPGVAESLPRFRALTGPVLRTPAEGIDTIVHLATVDPAPPSGKLWFDRRPRSDRRLPATATGPDDRARLWRIVSADVGLD